MAGVGEANQPDQPMHLAQPWMEFVQAALAAAHDVHRVLARVSGGWHLSDMELMLLWSCAQPTPDGCHSETDLAEPLGMTSTQWSAALYDLRDRGLMAFQRIPDGDERRPLTITPLGHAALEDVSRALAPLAAVWNSEVGASELRECVQLLRRLSDISSSSRLERSAGGVPAPSPRWTRLHRGAA